MDEGAPKSDSLSYHSIESFHCDQASVYTDENLEMYENAMKCLCFECQYCLAAMELQKYPMPQQQDLEFITSYDINEEYCNIYNYANRQNELHHPEKLLEILSRHEYDESQTKDVNNKIYQWIHKISFISSLIFLIGALILVILSEYYRNLNKDCEISCNSGTFMVTALLTASVISLVLFVISLFLRLWSSRRIL